MNSQNQVECPSCKISPGMVYADNAYCLLCGVRGPDNAEKRIVRSEIAAAWRIGGTERVWDLRNIPRELRKRLWEQIKMMGGLTLPSAADHNTAPEVRIERYVQRAGSEIHGILDEPVSG
jgi:hypothetical protein